MSGVPQESILEPVLLNTFINDSGIEYTLSESVHNTKLSGAVDMAEGQDAIEGDLGKNSIFCLLCR